MESPYLLVPQFCLTIGGNIGQCQYKAMAIFKTPLPTLWQSFMVYNYFCPVPVSLLSLEYWFPQKGSAAHLSWSHSVMSHRCVQITISNQNNIRPTNIKILFGSTSVILNISLWESPRPENWTLFSIITGRILVGMITSLVWDDTLQTATAHSWFTDLPHCLWDNRGNQHNRERRLTATGQKWWSIIKLCQRSRRGRLNIIKGLV